MLTNAEKTILRQLVQSPQWTAVIHLADELTNKIKDEPIVFDDQWKTISATLTREGQVKGIARFMQEINLHAHDVQ